MASLQVRYTWFQFNASTSWHEIWYLPLFVYATNSSHTQPLVARALGAANWGILVKLDFLGSVPILIG